MSFSISKEQSGELSIELEDGEIDPVNSISYVVEFTVVMEPAEPDVGMFSPNYIIEDVKILKAFHCNSDSGSEEEIELTLAQIEEIEVSLEDGEYGHLFVDDELEDDEDRYDYRD